MGDWILTACILAHAESCALAAVTSRPACLCTACEGRFACYQVWVPCVSGGRFEWAFMGTAGSAWPTGSGRGRSPCHQNEGLCIHARLVATMVWLFWVLAPYLVDRLIPG
jgi:hypothetical protein